jgi:formylglycine-generating enzyme required for sulfatase activity
VAIVLVTGAVGYSDTAYAGIVPKESPERFELIFWDTIKDSDNPADYDAYLEAYPRGRFAPLARARAKGLREQQATQRQATAGPKIEDMDAEFKVLKNARLRQQPDASSKNLGTLKQGSRIIVTGKVIDSNWYRIETADGKSGFVFGKLIAETQRDAEQAAAEQAAAEKAAAEKAAAATAAAAAAREAERKAAAAEAERKAAEKAAAEEAARMAAEKAAAEEAARKATEKAAAEEAARKAADKAAAEKAARKAADKAAAEEVARKAAAKEAARKAVAEEAARKAAAKEAARRAAAEEAARKAAAEEAARKVAAEEAARKAAAAAAAARKAAQKAAAEAKVAESARRAAQSKAAGTKPSAVKTFKDCDACPEMIALPAGSFTMGSKSGDVSEAPPHRVKIGYSFAISRFEVTAAEWKACLTAGGCDYRPKRKGMTATSPVHNLSWLDAQQYVKWLSKKTGKKYRLPSEAEWEYAARAGTKTAYWWGDAVGEGNANCKNCGGDWNRKRPAVVDSHDANPFGLQGMNGSVWEWVADCWFDSYKGAPNDGSARDRKDCQSRVLRGGSWRNDASYARSAGRFTYDHDVRYVLNGFRVVRSMR